MRAEGPTAEIQKRLLDRDARRRVKATGQAPRPLNVRRCQAWLTSCRIIRPPLHAADKDLRVQGKRGEQGRFLVLSTGLQRDSGSGEARSHGAVGVAEQSLEVGSDIERATGRAAGRAAAAGHDLIRTGPEGGRD